MKLLTERKLDAAAGRLGKDEFVGAMYFPGSQIVVLSAKTSVPDRMTYLLLQKSVQGPVHRAERRGGPAVARFRVGPRGQRPQVPPREERGAGHSGSSGGRLTLDGEWRKAKISEAEYTKQYQAHDQRYRLMVEAMITALKEP